MDRNECKKDLKTDVITHENCWEKLYRNSMQLPSGSLADPDEATQLEWYFMTFCRGHRANYLAVGHDLAGKIKETLAEFKRVQRERDVLTGE